MEETTISPNNIYELALPDGYTIEENEEAVIIYNEEKGSGAINIKSYQIPTEYVFNAKEELRDFASAIHENINTQNLQVIINENTFSEFIIMGRFWKIWVFCRIPYAVFASYNCDENDKSNEIDKVNNILQSLKIIS